MLIEILLIVFSVNISSKFKQAGQPGAKKYILGIWMTYLGAFILAVALGIVVAMASGEDAMIAVIFITLICGYIAEIIIAVRGMSHGKRLLQEAQMRNYNLGYQYHPQYGPYPPQGPGQQQYPPQYPPMQQQVPVQQPQPQQYMPVQQQVTVPPSSTMDAFSALGFTVRDFRSETEKQAEQKANQPLEPELERYASEVADAFTNYDGSSLYAESATRSKVRPIGEKLNNNEKQLRVYHRAVVIAASRGIRISSSTMERFWEGCGGWQV